MPISENEKKNSMDELAGGEKGKNLVPCKGIILLKRLDGR